MTPMLRRFLLWGLPCWLLGIGLRFGVDLLWDVADQPRGMLGVAVHVLLPVPFVFALTAGLRRLSRANDGLEAVAGSFRIRTTPAVNSVFLFIGYLSLPAIAVGDPLGLGPIVAPLAAFAFMPQLVLTPAGLELRWSGIPGGTWAEITAAELITPGSRGRGRALRLTLGGPGRRARIETIPLRFAAQDAFLVAAVRHYVEHPEHRAAIGTEAELARLRTALAG